MSTNELSKHIYNYCLNRKNNKHKDYVWNENDDLEVINYISNLIELHFDPQSTLGSKGFLSTTKDIRSEFGC